LGARWEGSTRPGPEPFEHNEGTDQAMNFLLLFVLIFAGLLSLAKMAWEF